MLHTLPVGVSARAGPQARASQLIGFSPRTRIASFQDRFCMSWTETYTITCWRPDGSALLTIKREVARRRVTAKESAAYQRAAAGYRADGSNRFPPGLREHRIRVAGELKFAQWHPALLDLFPAQTGELWIREYNPDDAATTGFHKFSEGTSSWSVFAPDGRWLATVKLPGRFVPTEIGQDYILGVTQDEDEVERVALHRLSRTP
jgi:hypothetical protein